jgi:hypothetical protein
LTLREAIADHQLSKNTWVEIAGVLGRVLDARIKELGW